MERNKREKSRSPIWTILAAAFIVLIVICAGCAVAYRAVTNLFSSSEPLPTSEPTPSGGILTVAYSPEKAALFEELVRGFNAQKLKTDQGESMTVRSVELEPEAMIEGALVGDFQAISPDVSIWLDQLDRDWMEQTVSESPLVGETARYAVSPVVIAMWEDVARSFGYPESDIGWGDILSKAQSDPSFKWSHPSTSSASGLLATLAEFYAGAGKTRGLTIEDAQHPATLEYVGAIEKTVRYYGEGEWAVVQQVLEKGPTYLDAFVCQEQLVIYFNSQANAPGRLVAIYPVEGSLWEDHPLALLETPDLTDDQRVVFGYFRDYVTSQEAQMLILSYGYRPADLSIPLDDPASPIKPENGVDPAEPQTTLQVPSPAVVEVVKDAWWYTKRHTNVYLVVDTSGSMRGDKLANAQEALRVFLDQIKGDLERVGLVEFSSQVNNIIPLDELSRNRADLTAAIEELEAGGDTALLDAINAAYVRLQELNDSERINAIVAMTDGRENHSSISSRELTQKMRAGNESGVPIVVFCIAYGDDADYRTLEALAEATDGQVRKGDLESIRQLYKILSTYF
ncbi:MAG: VWA domain-containing protein [Anaerolineales bacterium]|nr:VWA domain-containing protein [Anaerolineales bacterium]